MNGGSLPDTIALERLPLAQAMLCFEVRAVSKLLTASDNKSTHGLSWLVSLSEDGNSKLVRSKL